MEMTAVKSAQSDSLDIKPTAYVSESLAEKTPVEKQVEPESKTEETQDLTSKEVEDVLEAFQSLSETIQTKLNFTVHEENNEIVVKVIDRETDQLIRQFPSDEMLALQDKMADLAGFLFNENV